ncbi:MAG: ATP-binding protein [Rhodocyclaceae bacterium]|nr:ATP-binding protein [Rhodocyclaceae bacterium]MBX3666878.1 ATP-binding protein [Rhodocyclaceae bacterium]
MIAGEEALSALLARAEAVLERLERMLPAPPGPPDWNAATAFRWRKSNGPGRLLPVAKLPRIRLADLLDVEVQKQRLDANTRQFLRGLPANNALLTGARGTGKSSLVKALLNEYHEQGLRLIEMDKNDMADLPDVVDLVSRREERFIVYCDDLSFEAGEPGYKALKSVLDGSVAAMSDNLLIYATSNRRHLMPEYHAENLETRHVGGEIHPGEAVEEKVSLSDRFGLWLSFYPFDQNAYLDIVNHWLRHYGVPAERIAAAQPAALQWALLRGSRSGRVASQFALDWAGHAGPN